MALCYHSGEEIHAGDRVKHAGKPARIGFVIDRKEFTPEFPSEQWAHCECGFIVKEDSGKLFTYDSADEDLKFLGRV